MTDKEIKRRFRALSKATLKLTDRVLACEQLINPSMEVYMREGIEVEFSNTSGTLIDFASFLDRLVLSPKPLPIRGKTDE